MRRPRSSNEIRVGKQSIIVYKAGSIGEVLGEFESIGDLARLESKKSLLDCTNWSSRIRDAVIGRNGNRRYNSSHFNCKVSPRYKK